MHFSHIFMKDREEEKTQKSQMNDSNPRKLQIEWHFKIIPKIVGDNYNITE